jgi:uncharacterized damage-inducible protein DinB
LIDELTRAVEGDPWHGDSIAKILDGVSAGTAATKPNPRTHSIRELVRHMTAWTTEVASRLAGHPAGEPRDGDWPTPTGDGDADWRRDVAALFEAHRRLIADLASVADAVLLEPTNDPRDRATGTGVTRDVLLHGLVQHYAYHGGQIALLKKMVEKT